LANDWVNAFTSTSVATSETAMTGSPYNVTKDSILTEVRVSVAGDAVTSLIEAGYVKLGCKEWAGREVVIPFAGANIRTAPAFPIPVETVHLGSSPNSKGLPCPRGSSITAVVNHVTGATPVTPRIAVFLGFEN
jgi:hypothetical protein